MSKADLHIHTHFSDSSLSPKRVVGYAQKAGLSTIGITDHDTIDGIDEAIKCAESYRIEVVPGVELSVEIEGGELHILGYFIDWKNPWFNEQLEIFRKTRQMRARLIVAKLKELNIDIDYAHVLQVAKLEERNGSISRVHIATVLHQTKAVKSVGEAFEKYLNYGREAYVPKFRLTPKQAIEMISKIGGIPVLAHPCLSKCNDNLIRELVQLGLKGLEVYHSQQDMKEEGFCRMMAQRYNLLMTGGSDCHGLFKKSILIGTVTVNDTVIKTMREMLGRT
ncbi:MAG: PHP domain-containing protein [bacterium]|nr:PHP domain-containing protein [bacterium]